MADYQITCVQKSASTTPLKHRHIIRVGVPQLSDSALTIQEIYHLMDTNNRFYTHSRSTGHIAWVEPLTCCGVHTLRTRPDRIRGCDLDKLPPCGYGSNAATGW